MIPLGAKEGRGRGGEKVEKQWKLYRLTKGGLYERWWDMGMQPRPHMGVRSLHAVSHYNGVASLCTSPTESIRDQPDGILTWHGKLETTGNLISITSGIIWTGTCLLAFLVSEQVLYSQLRAWQWLWRLSPSGNWVILIFSGRKPCTRKI